MWPVQVVGSEGRVVVRPVVAVVSPEIKSGCAMSMKVGW